jgi:hypothetical protein
MQNYNTSMPVGRNERETNDCTVIALHNVTGLPYAICRDIAAKAGRVMGKGMFTLEIEADLFRVCRERGIIFEKLDFPMGCITIEGLAHFFREANCYVLIRGHALATVAGVIHDPTRSFKSTPVLHAWRLVSERTDEKSFAESLF